MAQITNEQKIPVTVAPVTASGKPAQIDGSVSAVITSGSGSIEQIDATSFYVVSGDIAESLVVEISADADLGSGVSTITDTITVDVIVAEATALGVSIGSPVSK